MNAQQKLFVEEYCKDGKGGPAAIRVGYAEGSAKQTAYRLLQIEEIQNAIKARYEELTMTAHEAIKRISDNASTRLNDYITVAEEWETPMVKKTLLELIGELQYQNEIDQEFSDRAGLTIDEQDDLYEERVKRDRQILRYEIELEMNVNAYRVVKGEARLVKKPGVDLIKLAEAKEHGSLKKLSFNERGLPSAECYPADKALETVLKFHGKLIKKIDHSSEDGSMSPSEGVTIDPSSLTPEELSTILNVIRGVQQPK